MAYEKQTWKTGDVITQEKLNHMEDGIANAGGSDGVRTCVALVAVQTGSSAGEGEPEEIAVAYLNNGNTSSTAEYLSFQDLYELYQNHDLIIMTGGGSFVQLNYNKPDPSWGIVASFSAHNSFLVSSSNGEAQWYDINITETSMTRTMTNERYFQLSANIPSN